MKRVPIVFSFPRIRAARSSSIIKNVCDTCAIETIDLNQIIEELAQASPNSDPSHWIGQPPLTGYDHVVLATDRRSGYCLGLLGAQDMRTGREEDFLFIRTGFVAEQARGRGLMQRMIALMLLRAARKDKLPQVIATRTRSGRFFRVLRDFASRIAGARIHPDPESEAIQLQAAGLARRIARQVGGGLHFDLSTSALRGGWIAAGGRDIPPVLSHDPKIDALFDRTLEPADEVLTLVDLRAVAEETVIEETRRIYRRHRTPGRLIRTTSAAESVRTRGGKHARSGHSGC